MIGRVSSLRERVSAPHAADWALGRGIAALTTDDLAGLLGVPADQVRRRLHAPAGRNEWVQPARGLWVPVPPEYRAWGAPPGVEIIGDLAAHLSIKYYVGWLSAAALHGASHHAPQVFQVATSRGVRDRVVGRTQFQFHKRDTDRVPVVHRETRSGSVPVSSVAATMLDLASDPVIGGGIDNTATVVVELVAADGFVLGDLVDAHRPFRPSALRRLGWLLDQFADDVDMAGLEALRSIAVDGPPTPARLDPARPLAGPVDERWMVRVNRSVEPDL